MTGRQPDDRTRSSILADGSEYEGEAIGALRDDATTVGQGELVFNTALSGYQEIVTDPSYAGQVITFTYPHIGNYGVNADDDESRRPFCAGVVVRDLAPHHSNWRSQGSFDDLLVRHGVPGISGIDTRRLTRHLRDEGALPGAFGTDEAAVRAAVEGARSTDGIDLVATVTTPEPYVAGSDDAPFTRRRVRLRHQAHHPAAPRRVGLSRRSGSGEHDRRGRAGSRARWCVPVERAG